MKKFLLTLAMVVAVMMVVVQPSSANQASFNITVTISSFSMELLNVNGDNPYGGWPITVPPGGSLTMVADDAVMISLTGDFGANGVDVVSYVANAGSWNAVEPPGTPVPPLADEFYLFVDGYNIQPTGMEPLALSNAVPITGGTEMPFYQMGASEDKAWLGYAFYAADNYTNPSENLEIMIEVKPLP